MRNEVVLEGMRGLVLEDEKWNCMERLLAEADDVQRDAHVDEALLRQVDHLPKCHEPFKWRIMITYRSTLNTALPGVTNMICNAST